MTNKHVQKACMGFLIVATLITVYAPPASTQEALQTAEITVESVEKANPEAFNGLAVMETSDQLTTSSENQEVSIPTDSSGTVSLSDSSNVERQLEVELPFSETNNGAEKVADNSVVIDNDNGSASMVSVREDASVQVHTVITEENAPTRYDYSVSVPAGGRMEIQSDGSVIVFGTNGKFIAGVTPAWAKDNLGNSIPTWYEVNGNVLTQVVEHDAAVEYPVVADPWFGLHLFHKVWRDTYKGDYRYNGEVSAWGAYAMLFEDGQDAMLISGWEDEWVAKFPEITNKATLRQQYNCHVSAGTFGLPFTGTYNLERFRRNNNNWLFNIFSHRCNW